ncbi:MAG: restriction endonuclease subunit S [Nitrospira sp.]
MKAVKVPIPPLDIQEQYYRRALMLGGSINQNKFSKNHLDRLFENLLVRAFAGDLTAKWREAHTKELLVEMEHQTQALSEAC